MRTPCRSARRRAARSSSFFLGATLCLGGAGQARAQSGSAAIEPLSVHVLAQPRGADVASDGIHRARLDQPVTLFAAVRVRAGRRRLVISDATAIRLEGALVPARALRRPAQIEAARSWKLRWIKIQPLGASYDNTAGGFHWDPIRYTEHALADFGERWQRAADAHPVPGSGYPDSHGGAGTMAFSVELRNDSGRVWAAPNSSCRFRGGLCDRVTRVAFRRDDSFLGRLSELFNTPYIWGSAGVPPSVHQAERLIGSDCADFIVYGARRMGKKLRYRATYHLPEVTRTIARAKRVDDAGVFVDARGRPLSIGADAIQPGDVLLFPRHVGALVADRPPEGVLDANDIMIHTYWAPPCEQPISETAYATSPVRVLRWR
ncbi:MAG: hypothetical protein JXR96_01390 [Deltaproteobacteria bacterium]|nr:hypothetical protein [Deltaproteobacteria bacterium]